MLIGTIVILWNRYDLTLARLFSELFGTRDRVHAEAIWNKVSSFQLRLDFLGLAITSRKLSRQKRLILADLIRDSERLSKFRNELIHSEYVVETASGELGLKSRTRSSNSEKFVLADRSKLNYFIEELTDLLAATEAAHFKFSRRLGRALAKLDVDICQQSC